MEILLSLFSSIFPYLIAGVGLLAVYLGIKRKGVVEERTRQEAAKVQEILKTQEQITEAVQKDKEINKRIDDAIKKIEEAAAPQPPSAPDKFRF